jgi:malate dehydrogenase
VATNASIVTQVAQSLLQNSPHTILVVVTNPVDTLTYLVQQATGLPRHRVIGLGGALDTARFRYWLAKELGEGARMGDIECTVVGAHSDGGMVPLAHSATHKGKLLRDCVSSERLKVAIHETKVGGATVTGLLGTSGWQAPGAAVSELVRAIAEDSGAVFSCSVLLCGEYGLQDVCLGVPVALGGRGVRNVVDVPMSEEERAMFEASAAQVREVNKNVCDNQTSKLCNK